MNGQKDNNMIKIGPKNISTLSQAATRNILIFTLVLVSIFISVFGFVWLIKITPGAANTDFEINDFLFNPKVQVLGLVIFFLIFMGMLYRAALDSISYISFSEIYLERNVGKILSSRIPYDTITAFVIFSDRSALIRYRKASIGNVSLLVGAIPLSSRNDSELMEVFELLRTKCPTIKMMRKEV